MKNNDYISSLANTTGKSWNSQLLILALGGQGRTRFRLPSIGASSITATWSVFIHPALRNVCPISHKVIPSFLPLNIFLLSGQVALYPNPCLPLFSINSSGYKSPWPLFPNACPYLYPSFSMVFAIITDAFDKYGLILKGSTYIVPTISRAWKEVSLFGSLNIWSRQWSTH